MKKILVFGAIGLFAFAGFRPPDGMRKFPAANIQFEVQAQYGQVMMSVAPSAKEDTVLIDSE